MGVAGAGGGILETIKGLLSGLVGFVKNIFGRLFSKAPATNPTTTTPAPSTGTTTGGPDDATVAQQFGLLNTPQNVAAFKATLAAQQAEADVIGPGTPNADACKELQQLLAGWGFPVQQTGQFDPATADAVMKFKTANGLTENFQFANGQPGVTPFVDSRTRQKMLAMLTSGQAPAATPATPAQPTTAPATPATPAQPAADTAAIATQFHLAPDAANVAAFQAAATEALGKGAIGPGNAPADAVTELQQLLAQWGFPVQATGQFDQATIDALLTYKVQHNLTDNRFKMSDGSAGVLPCVDEATQNAMLQQLQGTQQPAATPATPAPTPAATTPTPAPATGTSQYQASTALSAEESQIAQQQGILATRENFDAFMKEAQALEAQNAIGPGSTDKEAITELQQILAQWGYPVQATGQFDQATTDAVIKFKKDNNLAATYKMVDGTAAFHPFIDEATKQAMIKKLGG
jgi:N-acetyl-anhydromuramyl-L-alanine amidase AmpD